MRLYTAGCRALLLVLATCCISGELTMQPSERSKLHRYARAFLISGDFHYVGQVAYAAYKRLTRRRA